ncbi:DNA polymerase III subunit gamma/tau [Kangiella marina]|uniref:DNA polymerase III subunit gamma/tau n=1 Tax=Kangiella marina TaxID=1079178 RepID=A0ABP8IPH0_9GAMM
MSYQVLARKWRPKNFQELRGQEHVSRALVNAIESGRLHHAYLFTGTRGVGKTTIARILSKCLNCEAEGVTATPCGQCGSCSEIDQGRFVDLIEVDAASRTKVDDTRELLENVQYRPTRGRYKVYLIDEVHMLSNSSFNALLKTLEEPPEHVIFLLATTDPQKLPVTVLSRCLQFHLKHMDEETIANHLQFILEQESIAFEAPSLSLIAQSAEGSMRDALSLLDQAIAYGQGKVLEDDIRTMLGTIDHKFMVRLLEALASKDSVMAIKAVHDMSHYPVDFADALKELLSRLHQVAVYQATEVMLDAAASYIPEFADIFDAADLQMYYQLGLHARRDLEWAPSAKQGLEMALLRMLAFQMDTGSSQANPTPKKKVNLNSDTVSSPRNQSEEAKSTSPETQVFLNETEREAGHHPVSAESNKTAKEPEKQPVKDDTSEVALTKSSEPELAGYEQFMQQDDREEDDSSDFYHQADSQSPIESEQAKPSPEQPESKDHSDDDEALASLHSALGLSLDGQSHVSQKDKMPEKPVPKEHPSKERSSEEPAKGDSDSLQSQVVAESGRADTLEEVENIDVEQNAEQASSPSYEGPESYDSDIERLMQASYESSNEPATAHFEETERPNAPQGGVSASTADELEFVPELDVPEEAMAWANLVQKLELQGTYHQIAQSSCAIWSSEQDVILELAPEQEVLLTASAKDNVNNALAACLGKPINIEWQLKQPSIETPAEIWQHQAKLKLQKACEDLNQHPFSQQLQQHFGAKIDHQSVTYLDS